MRKTLLKNDSLQPLARYASDILAWEYDQRQPLPLPGEIEWYLKYVKDPGSPILELACGSGRLLIPIAKAGFRIDGVDSSSAMLKRLQQKLKDLDVKKQQKVRVFHADSLEFKPPYQYRMVMIAYNSLRELDTKEKVLKCFEQVYRFLTPGGIFLFTIRRMDTSRLNNTESVIFDSTKKPFIDEDKELSVGARIISHPDANNRMVNEQTYIIKRRGYPEEIINFTTYTNTFDITGYLKMLNNLKFRVKIYSGYEECPEDGTSKEVCFLCRK